MPSMDAPYDRLLETLGEHIPETRLITDPLRTLAYGTDASFYRLIPKVVVRAETEAEIVHVLKCTNMLAVPVTFRAAGTSLSGQAVSDAVLLVAGEAWQRHEILDNGARIRLQPGIIGARANRYLAPYGRKIGPDPASINAAMIGGILANNASGMCCGVAQNSYQTVASLRVILADGALLDTGDDQSRAAFARTHGHLLEGLERLAGQVRADAGLTERIRHKFKIKNTTGYSLNALVDYEDPFDILAHLMVGSEGTLAFVSEVTYHTVVEHPCKASALMIFNGIREACETVTTLKKTPVAAVELMDRAALESVADKPGMPGLLKTLAPGAAALLVESRAKDNAALAANIDAIAEALATVACPAHYDPSTPTAAQWTLDCPAAAHAVRFTADDAETAQLWNIRKGLFPSVGAMRRTGTTVIIEDVAFPIERLADATLDLQQLFKEHHYDEAIIFGHALEGNLHFVFTQDFNRPSEVTRYRRFMADVCDMVVRRYDGSLKAEHGTGRNMAPFLELEWGKKACDLMKKIKALFDPKRLLNPGVILNDDDQAHIRHLKPLPPAHPLVDKCIECGFCEETCPSKALTLTPRQRIVVQREIARLKRNGRDPARLAQLNKDYAYQGEQTCAADGLCSLSCPVAINTGDHTKYLRSVSVRSPLVQSIGALMARRFDHVTAAARAGLTVAHALHSHMGTPSMNRMARRLRQLSGNRLPQWTPSMPTAAGPVPTPPLVPRADRVVYFPSCVSRTMGPAAGDPCDEPLAVVTHRILTRAGFVPIHLPDERRLCCGLPFESKGLIEQADAKAVELEHALLKASEQGRYPVLCDTSPCIERMRRTLTTKLRLYEPVEFLHRFLLPRLKIIRCGHPVAVHVTCSARKMGLEQLFHGVADALAEQAVFPDRVDCCGFAGDRGFSHPELNRSALTHLRPAVAGTCKEGYSNSRTCEIGLSHYGGIPYRSFFYLADACSLEEI